ncbi:hypothetical protein H2198_001887 [Neophaeococcomyces mojaviensis]|uniref:Uncharacterized protein n=1 Tax=Neophaeococcomyces mojaviensis TaxID=3383035 RepID=A0ACC3AFM3_9EURO|nr:hypothetical protein H2198_001887 [Knufia sp. JES_112]
MTDVSYSPQNLLESADLTDTPTPTRNIALLSIVQFLHTIDHSTKVQAYTMSSSRIIPRSLPSSPARLLQRRPHYIISTSTQRRLASNLNSDFRSKKQAQEPQNTGHIDRQSYEYTQTSTDDAIASNTHISYDLAEDNTAQGAKDRAGQTSADHNPLEVSAANPEVSSGIKEEDSVARRVGPKETTSYHGRSAAKSEMPKEKDLSGNRAFAGSDTRRKDITEEKPSRFKNKVLPSGTSGMMP